MPELEQRARVGAGTIPRAGKFFWYKWASSGHSDQGELLKERRGAIMKYTFHCSALTDRLSRISLVPKAALAQ